MPRSVSSKGGTRLIPPCLDRAAVCFPIVRSNASDMGVIVAIIIWPNQLDRQGKSGIFRSLAVAIRVFWISGRFPFFFLR